MSPLLGGRQQHCVSSRSDMAYLQTTILCLLLFYNQNRHKITAGIGFQYTMLEVYEVWHKKIVSTV